MWFSETSSAILASRYAATELCDDSFMEEKPTVSWFLEDLEGKPLAFTFKGWTTASVTRLVMPLSS